jgi:hypothetical protein
MLYSSSAVSRRGGTACQLRSCKCLNRLLRALEGKAMDFTAYARNTPKGKATECRIYAACARRVHVPGEPQCPGAQPLQSYPLSCCRPQLRSRTRRAHACKPERQGGIEEMGLILCGRASAVCGVGEQLMHACTPERQRAQRDGVLL